MCWPDAHVHCPAALTRASRGAVVKYVRMQRGGDDFSDQTHSAGYCFD